MGIMQEQLEEMVAEMEDRTPLKHQLGKLLAVTLAAFAAKAAVAKAYDHFVTPSPQTFEPDNQNEI